VLPRVAQVINEPKIAKPAQVVEQESATLPREVDKIRELGADRCAIVVKGCPIKEITLGRSPRRVADHAGSPANQCNGATTVQL